MPQPEKESRTDTPQRQYPGYRGSAEQAQEYINEYPTTGDDPAEGARDIDMKEEKKEAPEVLRRPGDVPVGPSEHDKLVPPSVAQGD